MYFYLLMNKDFIYLYLFIYVNARCHGDQNMLTKFAWAGKRRNLPD